MGLDMRLCKKKIVKNWTHFSPEEQYSIIVKRGEKIIEEFFPVIEITYEICEWRKANAIHNWFVENIQGGEDDCGTYSLSREQLQELLETVNTVLDSCELVPGKVNTGITYGKNCPPNGKIQWKEGKVIKNPEIAHKLLPTIEGFFFGSTDYDEYYYQDLIKTKNALEKVLSQEENFNDYYEYSSSW